MPSVTWAMDSASFSTALTISPMAVLDCITRSRVFFRVADTSLTIRLPRPVACTEFSIRPLVALAASSDLEARLRTSSATTAKPLPAEPARAASTAAFRARMLVWKAISSMVAIIFSICWEASVMSFMAATICSICWPLMVTCSPVCLAFSCATPAVFTFSDALLDRVSRVAYSSSTALACSVAPWARDWAPLDRCSALPVTFSWASQILPMAVDSRVVRMSMDSSMELKSPIKDVAVLTSKLPSASCSISRFRSHM